MDSLCPSVIRDSMRKFAIVYSAIAIWTFGWLVGSFGLWASLFASIVVFAPAVFARRMTASSCEIKLREYGYLTVVTVLAIVASVFVVNKWYETGMDRLAFFDREYHSFRRHVLAIPEYRNVEISYTHRKGGRVYLHGNVADKDSHERLIQTIEWMLQNNDSGYYDGVEYPGKSDEDETSNGA